MLNFQDLFETSKQSFSSAFSICMIVPLNQDIHIRVLQRVVSSFHFFILLLSTICLYYYIALFILIAHFVTCL